MEDRLSILPDDLLHSILRGVPLKHAARTSALSRRWVAHWISALAANPVLDFTDSNFARGQPPARAAATVDRCLRLHAEHGTPLHAFRVALVPPSVPGDGAFGRDVVGWIAAAVARGAREVDVDLLPPPPSQEDAANAGSVAFRLELPRDLFRARNSLERLALGRLSLRAVPLPAAGFAGLRSLSLSHTDVTDEALRGVLASCGALESLSLRCCSLVTAVSVASERLRVMELLGCRAVGELRVAAPALESFTLYGDVILCASHWPHSVAVDFGAAPALRDVYLSQIERCRSLDHYYYPFVYHVPQARILTLCSVGLVVSNVSQDDEQIDHFPYANLIAGADAYIAMPNLQELQLLLGSLEQEISAQDDPRFPERVYYFFDSTKLPVLERLFIRLSSDDHADGSFSESDEDEDDERIGIFISQEIVLGQLTFMKVVDFRGTWRERRLVAYLLKRAPILEQLVLVTVAGEGATGDEQSEERAPGDEQSEEAAAGDEHERPKNIKEWASRLEKASREARITVCRPSEDDSPNHAHTRFFHEEYCCP